MIQPDLTIVDTFSYDAYGVMLGSNPTSASPAATNLLYAGEQWDTDAQHYYNRARWYNPMNGLFNRMDTFSGNPQDPQSLHKYLYCHNNPVNGTDSGGTNYSMVSSMMTFAIISILFSANVANAPGPMDECVPDTGGEMVLDMGVTLGITGGVFVARFIFNTFKVALSPHIRSLFNNIRFGKAVPVSSVRAPITNPSRLLTGSTQLEINKINGDAFENSVRASLRTVKGTPVITAAGKVVPDLPVGNMYGVTDAKNVIKLYDSPQFRNYRQLARSQKQPFNLIISPRTQTVSRPLRDAIKDTGGIIVEFDSVSGVFKKVNISGNKVIR